MKKIVPFVFALLLLLIPAVATAQNEFASWEDLIPYIESMEARIEELESQIIPGVVLATWDGSDLVSVIPDSNVGEYGITINKFVLNKTDRGEDLLTIHLTFTNGSSETTSFYWGIDRQAFQSGIEIDHTFNTDLDINYSTDIRPGVSIPVAFSFELSDTENPVELELNDSSDWSAEPTLYIFDLSQASKE